MGLYAYFDVIAAGMPQEVTASDIGYPEYDDKLDPIEVDYAGAVGHMCETFMSVATELVPVDTGYLQSTIHTEAGATYAEFFAEAEYAQYVEYGTIKMGAQPYFQPALDEALEVFIVEAMLAYKMAAQQMEAMLKGVMEAAMQSVATMMGESFAGFTPQGLGQMSTGAYLGGLAFGMAIMILAFPLLVNLYGIMDTLMAPFDPVSSAIDNLEISGIEVVIT